MFFIVFALFILWVKTNLIQLPSAKDLREKIEECGFSHFSEKTKIVDELGGRRLYEQGVHVAVQLNQFDYEKALGNNMMLIAGSRMNVDILIGCIVDSSVPVEKNTEL